MIDTKQDVLDSESCVGGGDLKFARHGLNEPDAIQQGLAEKAAEFRTL